MFELAILLTSKWLQYLHCMTATGAYMEVEGACLDAEDAASYVSCCTHSIYGEPHHVAHTHAVASSSGPLRGSLWSEPHERCDEDRVGIDLGAARFTHCGSISLDHPKKGAGKQGGNILKAVQGIMSRPAQRKTSLPMNMLILLHAERFKIFL